MRTPDSDLYKDKIEISLDGRQVFYLFFGGAVIACLVFVLGVMVGRRVEARAHVDKAAATSAARDPLAALDRLDGGDSMSFRSQLAGGAPAGDDEAAAAIDRARAEAKAPAPKVEEPKAEPPKPEVKLEEPKPEPKKPEPKKEEPKKVEAPVKAPDPGKFTLQLSSFQERTEAESFLADVRATGYKPYLVEADVEGKGRYYRIRLGSYSDYETALAAKEDFEAKVNKIAYVTRL